MTKPTDNPMNDKARQASANPPPLFLLEPPSTARPSQDEDWRLSRSAKPLRTWRLSK